MYTVLTKPEQVPERFQDIVCFTQFCVDIVHPRIAASHQFDVEQIHEVINDFS